SPGRPCVKSVDHDEAPRPAAEFVLARRREEEPGVRHLMWLRSDLRAGDNTALHHAAHDAGRLGTVIAAFVIAPQEWTAHDQSPARLSLMLRSLAQLSGELARLRIPLLVEHAAHAEVPELLLRLARRHRCEALYFNSEYE